MFVSLILGSLTIKCISDGAQYILIKLLTNLNLLKYYHYYSIEFFNP